MKFVDSHAHLDFPQFDSDRTALVEQLAAEEIGVINISTSPESISEIVKLASNNTLIWGLLGIHPTDIQPEILTNLPAMLEGWKEIFSNNAKIVGIGEVGLDYYHDRSTEAANGQKAALRQFLTFAKEQALPVSIHCREAYGDLLTMLGDYSGVRAVIHCYNGSATQAQQFLGLGCMLSFTGMLTYPQNETLREIVKTTPLEKIMLETDCPFLPLQEKRGQRNDPTAIPQLAAFLAQLKAVTVEEVAKATTNNAQQFFRIGEITS